MVISQKAKNIFNRLYIWGVSDNFIVNYDSLVIIMLVGAQCLPVRACLCVPACACTHADRYARRQVRTQTGIVPSPYYYLISPVGTMHRAPTLPFPDQVEDKVEDRFVYFLGYNHNIEFKTS